MVTHPAARTPFPIGNTCLAYPSLRSWVTRRSREPIFSPLIAVAPIADSMSTTTRQVPFMTRWSGRRKAGAFVLGGWKYTLVTPCQSDRARDKRRIPEYLCATHRVMIDVATLIFPRTALEYGQIA